MVIIHFKKWLLYILNIKNSQTSINALFLLSSFVFYFNVINTGMSFLNENLQLAEILLEPK